jgi:hypothetical protein
MGTLALIFFALRAFSSGCTALTGVEAIANGVPAFRKPKAINARITLLMMGLLACTMFAGITILAVIANVRVAENPCDLIGFTNCHTEPQRTVIAQLASSIFGGDSSIGFFYIQAATALILVLAANTAFNGFPLLGSILAQDSNLPRQLHKRGDRLVYSNGILMLAVVAGLLIFIYKADVTRLIQLYIIGVFTSFTLGQSGMVRHWNRTLRTERDPAVRRRIMRSRAINAFGASLTGLVLVIVTITKFTKGAYLVLIAMPILYALMRSIYRHYARVGEELEPDAADIGGLTLPTRNHAVVLVSKLHKPTLRALSYARGTRPDTLTALTVNVDEAETRALLAAWERQGPAGEADRSRVAVPRGHLAGDQVRQGAAQERAEGHRERVHPGVRGRALVGKPAAQPVRAAAEGTAAVPAGRDGDQRAVAARLLAGTGAAAVPAAVARGDPRAACLAGDGRRPRCAYPAAEAAGGAGVGRGGASAVRAALSRAGKLCRAHSRARCRRGGSGRTLRGAGWRRRPGGVRAARPARRAGAGPGHGGRRRRLLPRGRGRGVDGLGRPGACALPARRPGALRRLRLAACRPGRAARTQGGCDRRAAGPTGRAAS